MEKKQEMFQYTLRVLNSYQQFIEMAYSEEQARKQVALILLGKEGIHPNHPQFEAMLKDCMQERLKLVYIR
ncbi:MAG: hypothetical protein NW226_05200 [Microscillaceae bacterium]|nr:hypothetical protein [Microscillaceae bacterium]